MRSAGKTGKLGTVADLYNLKAAVVLGSDLSFEHPLLAYQIRANKRHHQAKIYVATPKPVREDNYAAAERPRRRSPGDDRSKPSGATSSRPRSDLIIVFGDSMQGHAMSASWSSLANRSAFR